MLAPTRVHSAHFESPFRGSFTAFASSKKSEIIQTSNRAFKVIYRVVYYATVKRARNVSVNERGRGPDILLTENKTEVYTVTAV
jgi:hypothetical protein